MLYLEEFFNLSADLLCIIGQDGCFQRVNPAWESVLGWQVKNLIGHPWLGLVHPEDKIHIPSLIPQKQFNCETRYLRQDGNYMWLSWSLSTGEKGFIYGIAKEITKQRREVDALQTERQSLRELRQKNQQLKETLQELRKTQAQLIQNEKMSSLGQLVAGVAHEINNPANFIYGNVIHAKQYTEDLLELLQLYQQEYPIPTPAIQEQMAEIDSEFLIIDLLRLVDSMKVGADRIRQIVLSLRNFSRLDEAKMKEVDIHSGIDSTVRLLQHRLKPKLDRPAIQVIKQYGQLPLVMCYAGQLNQVFMHIFSNAIDAIEESQAKINANSGIITISTTVSEGDRVTIRIADNGIGITEQVRQRIFDPFFTTKPVGEGTGLGLAISHSIIVEKHGGQIEFLSTPGQGAEFLISIPIHQTCQL